MIVTSFRNGDVVRFVDFPLMTGAKARRERRNRDADNGFDTSLSRNVLHVEGWCRSMVNRTDESDAQAVSPTKREYGSLAACSERLIDNQRGWLALSIKPRRGHDVVCMPSQLSSMNE
jgi:hypothetical protein